MIALGNRFIYGYIEWNDGYNIGKNDIIIKFSAGYWTTIIDILFD
jgi:hypothetical protein